MAAVSASAVSASAAAAVSNCVAATPKQPVVAVPTVAAVALVADVNLVCPAADLAADLAAAQIVPVPSFAAG